MIFATTPAPTVRPPSRIAKRKPWSIAIGWIKLTVILMLSPGITISTPSGTLFWLRTIECTQRIMSTEAQRQASHWRNRVNTIHTVTSFHNELESYRRRSASVRVPGR